MIIQSKYTKIFHSNGLTRQKYDELHDFAVLIQNHKNTVSQYVNDNLLHLLEYNKFQFLKEMRECFKGDLDLSIRNKMIERALSCNDYIYSDKVGNIYKNIFHEASSKEEEG